MVQNKKNILLVIRRGSAEIEWIAPIIQSFDFKFNLYVFFLTEEAYENCINDKVSFSIIKKYQKKQFIQKKMDRAFIKGARRILPKNIFFPKLTEIIHDTRYLKSKLLINKNDKIDLVLAEFGNYSQWIAKIKKNDLSKVVHFPSTPAVYLEENKKSANGVKKLLGDYLLVNSKIDIEYWSKFIKKNKIFSFGVPMFEKTWLKKKIKKNKNFENKKYKKILFAYSSYFGQVNSKDFIKLDTQLNQVMQTFNMIKNVKIIVKIHPNKNHPHFLNILKKYNKNLWEVSDQNLISLSNECDVVVSNFQSAASIFGPLMAKPSIELWKGVDSIYNTNKSWNTRLGITTVVSTKNDLKKKLNKAINRKNDKLWLNQRKKFVNIFSLNRNASKKISDFVKKQCLKY